MRYKNQPVKIRATATITLARPEGVEPISLRIAALPLGINELYETVFPRPLAPFTIVEQKGQDPRRVYDYSNPAYVKQFVEWQELHKFFFVFKAIESDPDLVFDNRPCDAASLRAFVGELRDAGITDGDLAFVMKEVTKLSNITAEDMKAARKSF